MRVGLFPGQGLAARVVLNALPSDHHLVQTASEILCYNLRRKVEQAARRERSVMPTSLAQPAIFTAGLVAWEQRAGRFDRLLGHSVGEYTALVAGGAMSFRHGLCVVAVRGQAMERVARGADGGMVAILGLALPEVEVIARSCDVVVANDNSPRQVVISGSNDSLSGVGSLARERGGRAVRLQVAGAYHSAAMTPAERDLAAALDHVSIRLPEVPVISNVSAAAYRAPGEIRRLLVEQLTGRVRFREAVERLWQDGATEYHDFGPGQVVAGLAAATVDELAAGPLSAESA